jgi:hypothetical protein
VRTEEDDARAVRRFVAAVAPQGLPPGRLQLVQLAPQFQPLPRAQRDRQLLPQGEVAQLDAAREAEGQELVARLAPPVERDARIRETLQVEVDCFPEAIERGHPP